MPLASAPAILNLLDGGVDPAFHIVLSRFRMMRKYLADCPEKKTWHLSDAGFNLWRSSGTRTHSFSFIFAAELGFTWGGDEKGWVRVSLPPLRMMTGPVQHFRSVPFWMPGASR